MLIIFKGERVKDFGLTLPVTGGQVNITPGIPVEVSNEDAAVIMATNPNFISYEELRNTPMVADEPDSKPRKGKA